MPDVRSMLLFVDTESYPIEEITLHSVGSVRGFWTSLGTYHNHIKNKPEQEADAKGRAKAYKSHLFCVENVHGISKEWIDRHGTDRDVVIGQISRFLRSIIQQYNINQLHVKFPQQCGQGDEELIKSIDWPTPFVATEIISDAKKNVVVLGSWLERNEMPWHDTAFYAKVYGNAVFGGFFCPDGVHASFTGRGLLQKWETEKQNYLSLVGKLEARELRIGDPLTGPYFKRKVFTSELKWVHGYHCSLYDTFESVEAWKWENGIDYLL